MLFINQSITKYDHVICSYRLLESSNDYTKLSTCTFHNTSINLEFNHLVSLKQHHMLAQMWPWYFCVELCSCRQLVFQSLLNSSLLEHWCSVQCWNWKVPSQDKRKSNYLWILTMLTVGSASHLWSQEW